ncbi:hypothetical protein ERJ75_000017200 [Trypanosoma vivax]|uniref:C3H1-type domain-containing protein n=1 Tax=Trypanosoma vivax (strain Y486) TaxID=1055687 RepID=G0U436_TRYVY|nr:hypothetical protein TRVL_02486 [Trypanosoma vivax]KAH8612102.1 hypothetical protein ERJ75_000932300 [Trypanosoma vivax]KAH8620873.1 hypothetical protein ERJ75_000017200 [Trypanosoma vivax]CCC52198.1 conserved hypothetical protein [Trypanosoma vivax Y486]
MSMQDLRAKHSLNGLVKVFDPNFKCIYLVPVDCVVHVPPARLNISRLVVCRNYAPGATSSCSKDESCRFVHADVDYSTLESFSIHVNYVWRNESLCTYERLPPGDVLDVLTQEDSPSTQKILSECILVTRGATQHRSPERSPLYHCPAYKCNGMCVRGEECIFIHALCIDPNVMCDFKRAPLRAAWRSNTSSSIFSENTGEATTGWSVRCQGESTSGDSLSPVTYHTTSHVDTCSALASRGVTCEVLESPSERHDTPRDCVRRNFTPYSSSSYFEKCDALQLYQCDERFIWHSPRSTPSLGCTPPVIVGAEPSACPAARPALNEASAATRIAAPPSSFPNDHLSSHPSAASSPELRCSRKPLVPRPANSRQVTVVEGGCTRPVHVKRYTYCHNPYHPVLLGPT